MNAVSLKSKQLKAAIIEPVGGHGGMNYYDFGLSKGLIRAGVDVTLYTCDETKVPEDIGFKVKGSFRGIYGKNPMFLRGIRYLSGLIQSLRDARIWGAHVVHYHFFGTTLFEYLNVRMARLHGFQKVIATVHDVEGFSGNHPVALARKICNACDKIIVHNGITRRELVERISIPDSKIGIIPHGNYADCINTRLDRRIAMEKLGITGDGPFLLFFGQIKRVKGLDILLMALPDVVQRFPSLKLIIAGKVWKDDFSRYSRLMEELGLMDRVIQHIRYIEDDMAGYYFRAADLVVLPYRRIYQSGVLLMAMSYGRPVIVSGLDGFTETIQDNLNGFVFREGDSKQLSERLIEVLGNPQRLEEIASAGLKTALENHDWSIIGKKTADLYKEIS